MTQETVLIIGTVWVEPNSSAAGARMLQLIELFLKNKYKITFASTAHKGEKAIDLKEVGVEEIAIELNAVSFDVFIQQLKPSIVIFDRFMIEEQFGWRVAEHSPKSLRILDTEDLHCLRKTRHEALKKGKEFSVDELLQSDIAKREIATIFRCDLSLIISSFEMDLLETTFKIDTAILCHLPFLLSKIDAKTQKGWKSFEDRKHFTIIGNFMHAPNVDAVLLLKKTIWKHIRKALPKAELHIYGAYPTQQILELHNPKEGFLIKGYTTNPEEIVQNSRVVLAPLQFGAGIKGKLTEAMICGAPSVTTSIGAEGMHNDLPWNGNITDDFNEFAEKAIALYSDQQGWEQAQQNGIQIINSLYDKDLLGPPFIDEIKQLQQQLKNHRITNFLGSLLQHQTLQSTKYMSKWIEAKNRIH
ncbi:MAG: glycosyltransferase family 4 protein [Flavobacteriaceae bacterium]|nr:glycosyltransferase family 4 protein [Flavobacteriaceae bacterium]